MDKLTYTIPELAEVLNVSEGYARILCNRKQIASVRLGRRLIVRKQAVDEFLRKSETPSTPQPEA